MFMSSLNELLFVGNVASLKNYHMYEYELFKQYIKCCFMYVFDLCIIFKQEYIIIYQELKKKF